MKKTTKVIVFLTIGGLVLFGWVGARLTNTLNFYTFASQSSMPTHKQGSLLFTSKLITPNYGKFVCFRNNVTQTTFIFRVIGKPTDVIEIKDAIVYRNGQKLDEPYTWNEYLLSQKQYQNITGFIKQNNNDVNNYTDSTYLVALTDAELKRYNLNLQRFSRPKGLADSQLPPQFKSKGYNDDNFGPVTVPANSYFVMGDNRHNALDSRYLGFIKGEDIVTTKIGD
jgi:signal peptidase I